MTAGGDMTDARLLAYADGQVSDTERAEVERYLATHPERAAEVAHWQRQSEAIAALYPSVANETVPDRLRPHTIARGIAANSNHRLSQIAAALVLVVLGGIIGWTSRDAVTPVETASERLIASAVTAHALYSGENRHAVEVTAADREHLVSWLSNRVTQPVDPPDLSSEGFALVGGRLLPPAELGETGPAAQLMYENTAGERVTVFITSALPDGTDAYQFTSRGPHEAFYWANDRITCTVVGELPEAAMQTVATKVYQHLTRRPDTTVPYTPRGM